MNPEYEKLVKKLKADKANPLSKEAVKCIKEIEWGFNVLNNLFNQMPCCLYDCLDKDEQHRMSMLQYGYDENEELDDEDEE